MSVEYFIARRSAETKNGGKPSVMVRVATISVALSVAMMIITLAIVFGYKREVKSSLTGFSSEATLTNVRTLNGSQTSPIKKSAEIEKLLTEQYGVTSLSPYGSLQGVVRNGEVVEGVMMRGVDSLYNLSFLGRALTDGQLPALDAKSTSRDVMLSKSLAARLELTVGDRLELIISEADKSLRRDQFKVCGLYSTGLDEWDRMVLITDLRNIQRLNSWSADQITGYELGFSSLSQAAAQCERINDELYLTDIEGVENLFAITAEQLYPTIFDWLKAHNVNAVVIIIIMLIVAGFNMATALLIMVLERTRMIGVLKSLGMNNRSLQRIFLYRAFWITLNGLAWGNGLSIAFCALQKHYHFISLDAESYLLRFVPIDLGWGWIVTLNLAVVAAIVALMIIPAQMVSRVKIEKTLKFES